MTGRAGQRHAMRSFLLAASVTMLLAACGDKKVAADNAVEMRDMEVVDGTINDAMTDLDAVRSDGVALNNAGGNSASPVKKAATAKAEPATDDAEAVPAE